MKGAQMPSKMNIQTLNADDSMNVAINVHSGGQQLQQSRRGTVPGVLPSTEHKISYRYDNSSIAADEK